jgi:hypothetical protein
MSRARSVLRNPLARLARDHPAVVQIGRAGWFAKGVVYLVTGVLALLIAGESSGWSSASTNSDEEASPTGALKAIAQLTGGALLMWALALGMLVYATWRVVTALLPGGTDATAWLKRFGYAVSAASYTLFAVTAMSLARRAGAESDGNSQVKSLSGDVMTYTGGRALVGVVGAVLIGVGIYRIVKGVHRDVNDELDLSALTPQRRRWTERLGAVGEIGRGLGMGLIGFFLISAAVTYDSDEGTGLDGALRRLATENLGVVVVLAVGVGFAAYGLFCLATFTHRELEAP